MTYSTDLRIVSPGRATAAQITAYYQQHAAAGLAYVNDLRARRKLPPLALNPIPDDIGATIIAAARVWPQHVVNHDALATQGGKESAFLQSEIARDKLNPSGLGAENHAPYENAITCSSWLEGFTLTVAHLLSYAVGEGPWTAVDPRYRHMSRATIGTKPRWIDLNGFWAVPGPHYGQDIIQRINDGLLTIEERGTVPSRTFPKPPMTAHLSPNRDGYSTSRKIEAVVNHIATSTKQSNLNHFKNPNSGASCNAYIDKQGKIYEVVPPESSPWTNGPVKNPDLSNPVIAAWVRAGINPNTRTYTIEHEGEPGDDLTPAQIAANNRVTAWVHSRYGVPLDRTHILGHYQIDSVDRSYCPSFTADEWRQLIEGARALISEWEGTMPDESPRKLDSGFTIRGRIRDFWERAERASVAYQGIGLPLSAEYEAQHEGRRVTRQDFERAVLQYDPSKTFPWDVEAVKLAQLPRTAEPDDELATLRAKIEQIRQVIES